MHSSSKSSPALGLTLLGGLLRLIPHPPNFAPVGAMSLFAGANLNGWQAYLVPLMLMMITDPLVSSTGGCCTVGNFSPFSKGTFFIYGSFMISVWIGRHLRGTHSVGKIGAAAFLCALQFFLITNLPIWLFANLYPHTISGLVACYIAALPFFGNTLASNLLYSALFFGAHFWLTRRQLATA
jgi:hypothetical protein